MEKIIKKKLSKLRDTLEAVAGARVYADALRLEGAIFHIKTLYDELIAAGKISTLEFKDKKETMIKTTISAVISREHAYEVGEKIGLNESALNLFSYFNVVELEIEVDKNGLVQKCKTALWED